MNIKQEAMALADIMVRDYRYLHAHAETGFELSETVAYVEEQLTAIGVNPEKCGKCGLTAVIGRPDSEKCLLLRADMDALPIREETGLDFACTGENMHACGHDAHTAMLLGAARLLKAREAELGGCIKLMFQPAEELLEGSKDMIKGGVLENPAPAAAFMLHVIPAISVPAGTVIIPPAGTGAPAADFFTVTVTGKGCHGSSPSEGIDPLVCGANILTALLEIPARELSPSERAVLTIGSFNGGSAANAIPEKAVMKGTLRAFDESVRSRIRNRITGIAQSIAAAYRTTADITFDSGCPTLINSPDLCAFAEKHLPAYLGENGCIAASKLASSGGISLGGSEDFAYVSHEIPALMLALAAGEPKDGYNYSLHHSMAAFDTSALPYGCAAFAALAVEWLSL